MPYNGARYNVSRRETYTHNGQEKTKWVRVGVVFMEQDGSKGMLKLDLLSEPFYLFPPKDDKDGYGG